MLKLIEKILKYLKNFLIIFKLQVRQAESDFMNIPDPSSGTSLSAEHNLEGWSCRLGAG